MAAAAISNNTTVSGFQIHENILLDEDRLCDLDLETHTTRTHFYDGTTDFTKNFAVLLTYRCFLATLTHTMHKTLDEEMDSPHLREIYTIFRRETVEEKKPAHLLSITLPQIYSILTWYFSNVYHDCVHKLITVALNDNDGNIILTLRYEGHSCDMFVNNINSFKP